MKNPHQIRLFIFLIITFMVLSQKENKQNLSSKNILPKSTNYISQMVESTVSVFFSGLFDKSFFITTLMASKHPKLLVLCAAVISLTSIGIFSVMLGGTIAKLIPVTYIDCVSIVLFLFFGIKMMLEGVNMTEKDNLVKLEEDHILLNAEEEQRIIEEDAKGSIVQNADDNITESTESVVSQASFQVFAKILILILFSELGDRSQITTIYLSSNYDKLIVVLSVILGQNILSLLAVLGGKLIAKTISEKWLTIIAGMTFVVFGVIAFYFMGIHNLLSVLGINVSESKNIVEIIPDRSYVSKF